MRGASGESGLSMGSKRRSNSRQEPQRRGLASAVHGWAINQSGPVMLIVSQEDRLVIESGFRRTTLSTCAPAKACSSTSPALPQSIAGFAFPH